MSWLIKKVFIGLLTSLVSGSNRTKCVSLSSQKYMIQPTLINLHPNEYSQKFHYYPFAVKLDRCVGSCNTLYDLSNKVCVPNKTEDLNQRVFNMITWINESKTLTKHISSKCKRKFGGRKWNSNQWCNDDKCRCECKKRHVCEKDYIWNSATFSCENWKYLASIMDDSAITCDEIIESHDEDTEAKLYDETKTIPANFNGKKATCKTQNFNILLAFLLITIGLLITVSIYCYLIKYWAKQKYLLPFHVTNNELKQVMHW